MLSSFVMLLVMAVAVSYGCKTTCPENSGQPRFGSRASASISPFDSIPTMGNVGRA